MPSPTPSDISAYLLSIGISEDIEVIGAALEQEKASQSHAVRVPADDSEWPADLVIALCRRVARNLKMRPLTLGFAGDFSSESGPVRVGGFDAEIRRLEAPYKRVGSFGA